MYSAYMFIKHIKLLQALQTLDPRLSYANQMEAVFDKPKAFLRGCIGLTGSTVSIHQNGRSPAGPVLYVHPKLGLSVLAVLLGTLIKRLRFFADPRAFRYPLLSGWLNKNGRGQKKAPTRKHHLKKWKRSSGKAKALFCLKMTGSITNLYPKSSAFRSLQSKQPVRKT
jgi:predicted component of type VI protein secretion system